MHCNNNSPLIIILLLLTIIFFIFHIQPLLKLTRYTRGYQDTQQPRLLSNTISLGTRNGVVRPARARSRLGKRKSRFPADDGAGLFKVAAPAYCL